MNALSEKLTIKQLKDFIMDLDDDMTIHGHLMANGLYNPKMRLIHYCNLNRSDHPIIREQYCAGKEFFIIS